MSVTYASKKYPKVHHIGDPIVVGIFDDEVDVEEKIDGSQFRIHVDTNGMFNFGSHRIDFPTPENNGMFQKAIESTMKNLSPILGGRREHELFIFAEFIGKNHQNTLTYDRIPESFITIFDILENGKWYDRVQKQSFANKYNFDCVPRLWFEHGKRLTPQVINELLKTESYLGGATIEGIVVKNYNRFFDPTKYAWFEGDFLVGKYVRQEFQELNQKEHASEQVSLGKIKLRYIAEARWDKAIQKLKEENKLESAMKDLALLVPEVKRDVEEECKEDIKEQLYNLYGKNVISGSVKGLPEYYNKKLLEKVNEV